MARKKNKQAQKDKKEKKDKLARAAQGGPAAAEGADTSAGPRAGKKHPA